MLWHRQACPMSGLDEDNVASAEAVNDPACRLKSADCTLARDDGQRGHLREDLDFPDLDDQRHPVSGTGLQAACDRLADVVEGFGFGASLRNTTGNRRAFRDKHAGFVGLDGHKELHSWILPQLASGAWRTRAVRAGGYCARPAAYLRLSRSTKKRMPTSRESPART